MSLKYRTGQGTSASNFTDLVVKVGDTLPIGTEVDYDGNTAPAGWQEVDNVLWTNPAPTADFAGQEITLSDSITNYSHYEVIYKQSPTGTTALNTGKIPINFGCYLLSNSNFIARRTSNVPNANKLTFADTIINGTYGQAGTTANGLLIPYQVIGYK